MKTDYKTLQAELDNVIESLQRGELDIDEALKNYERGMKIVEELETYLKTAENKITKLKISLEK